MLQALFSLLVVAAMVSWGLAVASALSVWRMSPPGEKAGNYFRLGLWRFAEIERRIGPQVRPILRRYLYGFFGFFACILIAIAATFIATSDM